jgi:hypothetical protein
LNTGLAPAQLLNMLGTRYKPFRASGTEHEQQLTSDTDNMTL